MSFIADVISPVRLGAEGTRRDDARPHTQYIWFEVDLDRMRSWEVRACRRLQIPEDGIGASGAVSRCSEISPCHSVIAVQ